jgi:hypothetical protein
MLKQISLKPELWFEAYFYFKPAKVKGQEAQPPGL